MNIGRGKGPLRPEDMSPSGFPECLVRGCERGEGVSKPTEGTVGIILLSLFSRRIVSLCFSSSCRFTPASGWKRLVKVFL